MVVQTCLGEKPTWIVDYYNREQEPLRCVVIGDTIDDALVEFHRVRPEAGYIESISNYDK